MRRYAYRRVPTKLLTPRNLTVDHPMELVERPPCSRPRRPELVEDAGDGGTLGEQRWRRRRAVAPCRRGSASRRWPTSGAWFGLHARCRRLRIAGGRLQRGYSAHGLRALDWLGAQRPFGRSVWRPDRDVRDRLLTRASATGTLGDAPELVELSRIGVTFLDVVSRYGARLLGTSTPIRDVRAARRLATLPTGVGVLRVPGGGIVTLVRPADDPASGIAGRVGVRNGSAAAKRQPKFGGAGQAVTIHTAARWAPAAAIVAACHTSWYEKTLGLSTGQPRAKPAAPTV